MRSVPSIAFEVRPSRLLAVATAGIAVLAVLAMLLSGMPWWGRLPLAIAAAAGAAHAVRKLQRPTLTSVGWHGDDRWTLALPGDTEVEGRLRSGRVLGPLIVLRLAWTPRGQAALALLPDNLDADTRRRLRMRLSVSADKP
jgi:toxin CptA